MIATFWLISILSTTMMREIECMYEVPIFLPTALQQHHQRFSNNNNNNNELVKEGSPINRFELEKRTLPSLSISNSLDVLRQRLMLEIARRQMREKSNQVELNREHLTRVGKRVRGMRLDDDVAAAAPFATQLLHSAQQHSIATSANSYREPQQQLHQASLDEEKSVSQEGSPDDDADDDDDENALRHKYRNALQFYRV